MEALSNNQGDRQTSIPSMQTLANKYFENLFTADVNLSSNHQQEILDRIPRLVGQQQNHELLAEIKEKEVNKIVFSMQTGKSPSPSSGVFQSFLGHNKEGANRSSGISQKSGKNPKDNQPHPISNYRFTAL